MSVLVHWCKQEAGPAEEERGEARQRGRAEGKAEGKERRDRPSIGGSHELVCMRSMRARAAMFGMGKVSSRSKLRMRRFGMRPSERIRLRIASVASAVRTSLRSKHSRGPREERGRT